MYPIAVGAKVDEVTMYFHKAMQESYNSEFSRYIIIEINGHSDKKHCRPVPKEDTPGS